ncbi:MAG: hypothetical protein KC609_14865 [Myxococcales bacterium]|nr:hypothetical protein [Myxococcales bacterium]
MSTQMGASLASNHEVSLVNAGVALVFCLLAALTISSCKKTAKPEACAQFHQRSTLRVAIPVLPLHLCELAKSTYWIRQLTLNLVLEPLVRENAKTGRIEPALAERYAIDTEKKTLTFYLRRGVTFHDGHALTADDVIFTLDTLMSSTFVNSAKRSDFDFVARWQKVDAHTVRIVLKSLNAFALLSFTDLQIYPRHRFFGRNFSATCVAERLIGSGPFRVTRRDSQRIELTRYIGYWGRKPGFAKLVFQKAAPEKLLLLLRRHEVDLVPELPADSVAAFRRDGSLERDYVIFQHPGNAYGMLGFNLRQARFQKPAVRRAFARLIDLERIRTTLYRGRAHWAIGPFHPLSSATPKLRPFSHDTKRGLELLTKAGWVDRDHDGVLDVDGKAARLRLLFRAESKEHRRLATVIRDQLRRYRIDVQLEPLAWGPLLKRVAKGDFDLFLFRWGPIPYHYDPHPFFHSKGSMNWIGYRDDASDRWIVEAQRTRDAAKRQALYRKLATKLFRDQVVQFHFFADALLVGHRCLVGVFPSALGPQFDRYAPRGK